MPRFSLRPASFALLLSGVLGLSACTPDFFPATGRLSLSLQFPSSIQTAFQTQLLKPETERVRVAVLGPNGPQSPALISAPLTANAPRAVFEAVPLGTQTVLAAAYDAEKRILTAGKASLVIVPGSNRVELDLQEGFAAQLNAQEVKLLQDLEPTPSPSPSPSASLLTPGVQVTPRPAPTPVFSVAPLLPQPAPFQLRINQPANGTSTTAGNTLIFEVDLNNTSGQPLTRLELLDNGTPLGGSSRIDWDKNSQFVLEASVSLSWNTQGATRGQHLIRAVMYSDDTEIARSEPVQIVIE